jgi:hypothetical protein
MRADILMAIRDRLQTIKIADGYTSDIGDHVSYWRDHAVQYEQDGCSFYDEGEKNTEIGCEDERRLTVEIQAVKSIQTDAIAESTGLIKDIIQAVGVDPSWEGTALNTKLVKNEKEIEAMGTRACRVSVTIEVLYRGGRWEY